MLTRISSQKHSFKFDEALTQLIEGESHLSDEELSLKQELEISITKFFVIYDEFIRNIQNLHFFKQENR